MGSNRLSEEWRSTERVHIVPAGYDPKTFYPASPTQRQQIRENLGWTDTHVLLNVGAMTPNKGIQTLLTAAAYMIDRGFNLLLVMKGTDSLYSSEALFREMIAGLQRDSRKDCKIEFVTVETI